MDGRPGANPPDAPACAAAIDGLVLFLLSLLLVSFLTLPRPGLAEFEPSTVPRLALLLVPFGVITVLAARIRRWLFVTLSAFGLVPLYMGTRVLPLGDHGHWVEKAATLEIYLSEPGANLIHFLMDRAGLLYYTAPVFGFLTALSFLFIAHAWLASDAPRERMFVNMLYMGSGIHVLFFSFYVENTYLSLPALMMSAHQCIGYLAGPSDSATRRRLLRGGLWLAVACFIHGQNFFLTPALPAVAALRHMKGRAWADALKDTLEPLALGTAIYVIALGLLWHLGFDIRVGNVRGGGDLEMFVPLHPTPFSPHTLFSPSHFGEISLYAALATPAFLTYPIIRFLARRDREKGPAEWPFRTVAGILSLGYFSLIFLWDFDLGFPTDYDLMVSMGIVLALYTSGAALRLHRRGGALAYALVLPGTLYSWWCAATLVTFA